MWDKRRVQLPTSFLSQIESLKNINAESGDAIGLKNYIMKKSIMSMMGTAVVALSLSSCASYQKEAIVMGIGGNKINTYVSADLDYAGAKKVSATVNTRTALGFIQLERNGNKLFSSSNYYKGLSKVERQALYRAKENANVDIILDPEFETEKHSWFFGAYKTKTTKVTGWGINIKGIKEDKNGIPNGNVSYPSSGVLGRFGR